MLIGNKKRVLSRLLLNYQQVKANITYLIKKFTIASLGSSLCFSVFRLDGSGVPGENVGWRDHITHGSLRRLHREAHGPCSTPSDMSGPPTPVHTSSPMHTQER